MLKMSKTKKIFILNFVLWVYTEQRQCESGGYTFNQFTFQQAFWKVGEIPKKMLLKEVSKYTNIVNQFWSKAWC